VWYRKEGEGGKGRFPPCYSEAVHLGDSSACSSEEEREKKRGKKKIVSHFLPFLFSLSGLRRQEQVTDRREKKEGL